MMSTAALRNSFLDFFQRKQHEKVTSSSLVPGNDKTLLFTNAGMVQFKDVFLGDEQRSYTRATSSQRCVRAGGKHNDLENVGYTARHHTFFEMLGNFSFGDYFKREAINYAWEYLTVVLKLPPEKLWITVFEEDHEAADIWLNEVGVSAERFSRIGAKDNFWQMGDTGPCGPCTEIFYDHGENIWGGPPGTPEEDGDRYIEIWNLVFMQYDRAKDGTMTPLPKPSVDTGMGLERLAAVMQGVHSNYEIDLFQALLKAVANLANTDDLNNASLNVIADHIRSCSFLIIDGVLPSNEGRGYVLRRIIRRAARHGHKLGLSEPFFHKLVVALVAEMGEAYPELAAAQTQVELVLHKEEQRFAETLGQGMKILDEAIAALSDKQLSGELIFKLYDTYGFPIDLTADIARERGLTLDEQGFEQAMAAQRARARAAGKFAIDYNDKLAVEGQTDFTGYTQAKSVAQVVGLFQQNQPVNTLSVGDEGQIILDATPFYAESGGQIGDRGELISDTGRFRVRDTQKQGDVFVHFGVMQSGELTIDQALNAEIDTQRRQQIVLNHSATHLMHSALREVLGAHVEQKGSLVTEERLRFDFSHFDAVTSSQLAKVEALVNQQIRANAAADIATMSMDAAREKGAMALFGEKYGDEVRVVQMGFSTELCGGTHVERTGDIGLFKIISEGGVAAGVRRIEAVTGDNALQLILETEQRLQQAANLLKAQPATVEEKLEAVLQKNRALEKELTQLKGKLASQAGSDLASKAIEIAGIKVLAAKLDGVEPKSLRDTVDQLKNKLGKAIIVLGTVANDKVSLVAGVTKAETKQIKAGDVVNHVAKQVGGKGGGRPDMAMAGGNNAAALDGALVSVQAWLTEKLV
jgi:alanyl-tRNA synthetase